MITNHRSSLLIALLLCLPLLCVTAKADECEDQSANFAAMGEQYFEFDNVPVLTDKEEKSVQRFVKNLYREWRVNVDEFTCLGNGEDLRKSFRSGTGMADITQSRLYPLDIDMDVDFGSDVVSESIELLAFDSVYNFNISAVEITAAQFYRNWQRPGILLEKVYRISKQKGTLHLQLQEYAMGRLFLSRSAKFSKK